MRRPHHDIGGGGHQAGPVRRGGIGEPAAVAERGPEGGGDPSANRGRRREMQHMVAERRGHGLPPDRAIGAHIGDRQPAAGGVHAIDELARLNRVIERAGPRGTHVRQDAGQIELTQHLTLGQYLAVAPGEQQPEFG